MLCLCYSIMFINTWHVCNIYRPQRSWGKVIFSEACVNNSVHGGGHAWLLGGCMVAQGGCAWFYSGGMRGFIWGGVHGFIRGACVVLLGVCGFIQGAHAWFYSGGACMVFSVFLDTMRYGQ